MFSVKRDRISLDFMRTFLKKSVAIEIVNRRKNLNHKFMKVKPAGLNLEDLGTMEELLGKIVWKC